MESFVNFFDVIGNGVSMDTKLVEDILMRMLTEKNKNKNPPTTQLTVVKFLLNEIGEKGYVKRLTVNGLINKMTQVIASDHVPSAVVVRKVLNRLQENEYIVRYTWNDYEIDKLEDGSETYRRTVMNNIMLSKKFYAIPEFNNWKRMMTNKEYDELIQELHDDRKPTTKVKTRQPIAYVETEKTYTKSPDGDKVLSVETTSQVVQVTEPTPAKTTERKVHRTVTRKPMVSETTATRPVSKPVSTKVTEDKKFEELSPVELRAMKRAKTSTANYNPFDGVMEPEEKTDKPVETLLTPSQLRVKRHGSENFMASRTVSKESFRETYLDSMDPYIDEEDEFPEEVYDEFVE